MRKFLTSFIVIVLMISGNNPAFGAVKELIAEEMSRSVDFIVSENISMTMDEDSEELSISPFVIQNNSDGGLKIKKISVEGQSGWSVVRKNTTEVIFELNKKIFTILTSDGYDLSEPLLDIVTIESGNSFTLNLSGKASQTSKPLAGLHIADFLVEVEPVSYKTVLYEDGTLIINEPEEKAEVNESKHGNTIATYAPFSDTEPYVFNLSSKVLWSGERDKIKRVEFGSKVQPSNMAYWFYGCSYLESFDSTNLDTSETSSVNFVFERAGYNSENFVLDLSGWNTSKVKTMSNAFRYSGYGASNWEVNLKGWRTDLVTSMIAMFEYSGFKASTWTLTGIENWNTENVTSFASMFRNAAKEKAAKFKLDLSEWNTNAAYTMKSMFELAGYSAMEWDIGDISQWKTSSLTNMELMFSHAGSSNYRLHNKDLSKWDTSKVTTMKNLFRSSGTYMIKLNIPAGCIVDGLLDQKPTVDATLTFEGVPSSYANIFRRTATSSTYGRVNLVSSDEAARSWFGEMISLYGPGGTTTKGYIYIV